MFAKKEWQKIVVASKIIITNSSGEMLILLRGKTAPSRPLQWDIPGGVVEEGEHPEEAVIREAEEEAGIKPKSVRILYVDYEVGRLGFKGPVMSFIYTCSIDNCTGEVKLSYEHEEYKWVSVNEFVSLEVPEKYKKAAKLLG